MTSGDGALGSRPPASRPRPLIDIRGCAAPSRARGRSLRGGPRVSPALASAALRPANQRGGISTRATPSSGVRRSPCTTETGPCRSGGGPFERVDALLEEGGPSIVAYASVSRMRPELRALPVRHGNRPSTSARPAGARAAVALELSRRDEPAAPSAAAPRAVPPPRQPRAPTCLPLNLETRARRSRCAAAQRPLAARPLAVRYEAREARFAPSAAQQVINLLRRLRAADLVSASTAGASLHASGLHRPTSRASRTSTPRDPRPPRLPLSLPPGEETWAGEERRTAPVGCAGGKRSRVEMRVLRATRAAPRPLQHSSATGICCPPQARRAGLLPVRVPAELLEAARAARTTVRPHGPRRSV